MSRVFYFNDRSSLDDGTIPNSFKETLLKGGLITPDDRKICFCGIVSTSNGEVGLFFPRNSSIEDQQSFGHNLLGALKKYFLTKNTAYHENDGENEVIGGKSLSLIISLLDDYRANGLYLRRTKENTRNSGKINWRRTITRNPPLCANGKTIYLDLQTSRSRYLSNSLVSQIHASILKAITEPFGKLWLGSSFSLDRTILRISEPSENLVTQISLLERELRLSYSERDIWLIRSLIQYLKELKGKKEQNIILGVRKFHSMWESMIHECLNNTYPVNQHLPVPVYCNSDGRFIKVPKKSQRTDTVLKAPHRQIFAVIDAKYYEASTVANAPGWPDLVKQFYYADAVKKISGDKASITNHFIFPGSCNYLKSAHVAPRESEVKSELECYTDYPKIHCHYLEPELLVKKYYKGSKLEAFSKFILGL